MNCVTLAENNNINLTSNPWMFKALKKDQQLSGKVISIRNNIVHVKIDDYNWLVGRGYYPLTFDADRGDEVYCKVKAVDSEKKEISVIIQYKKAC